jgi:hypothetical protein
LSASVLHATDSRAFERRRPLPTEQRGREADFIERLIVFAAAVDGMENALSTFVATTHDRTQRS